MRRIRIATRNSELALWQARHVAALIEGTTPHVDVQIVPATSAGDRDLEAPLSRMGPEGAFTRGIQEVLLAGDADLAVHSLKDLPTSPTPGLVLASVPARGPREDVLLAMGHRLSSLPVGSRVGTGSPRRQAFLAAVRPDLRWVPVRGNVPTRLARLAEGAVDALVLARAGLDRLGRSQETDEVLSPFPVPPAVGQGALAIEARSGDALAIEIASRIESWGSRREVDAERAFLAAMGGGCQLPLGAWCEVRAGRLHITGSLANPDGATTLRTEGEGPADRAEAIGKDLALRMLSLGGRELLEGMGSPVPPG